MMLQPRKFKYKTKQKGRSSTSPSTLQTAYGQVAVVLLRPFRISAKKIFRLNLFLKKSARKSDKTKRAFWLAVFPHLPLSRKPKGMRMGKGAGKLSSWYTQIRSGKAIVEFRNLRLGRACYFTRQVQAKLPVPSALHLPSSRHIRVVGAKSTNTRVGFFW